MALSARAHAHARLRVHNASCASGIGAEVVVSSGHRLWQDAVGMHLQLRTRKHACMLVGTAHGNGVQLGLSFVNELHKLEVVLRERRRLTPAQANALRGSVSTCSASTGRNLPTFCRLKLNMYSVAIGEFEVGSGVLAARRGHAIPRIKPPP